MTFIYKKNRFFEKITQQDDKIKYIENKFVIEKPKEAKEEHIVADKVFNKRQKLFYLVATNKSKFSQELAQLFASLKERSQTTSDEQWLYLYFLCLAMKLYFQGYGQKRKEEEYEELAKQIKARCISGKFPKPTKENVTFLVYLKNKAIKEFDKLLEARKHIEDLRNWDSFLNLVRLYWTFCRIMLTNTLLLARSTNILEKLDKALGLHTDVDQVISVLNGPNSVFRALSIGLFVVRILLNTASLIKHTCFPSDEELKQTWQERLAFEIKKRQFNYINDFVWTFINAITNYNTFFHIAGASAGYITAGFLLFDVMHLIYQWNYTRGEYMEKKAQYLDEIKELSTNNKEGLTAEQIKDRISTVNKQLHELELSWNVDSQTILFYSVAAFLLFSGFTASLFFTPLGAMVVCYAVCTLAAGMYLSGEVYKEWKDKQLRLEDVKTAIANQQETPADSSSTEAVYLHKKLTLLDKQYIQARNDLIWTIAKNTIIPALTIAVFAVCWQAALVLVVGYIAYEIYNAKQKKSVPEDIDDLDEISDEEQANSLPSSDDNRRLLPMNG